MVAPPPSLHPRYRVSSVLFGDPTSTAPSAFLASSARTGILPRGRKPWTSLVTVMTDRPARTGLRPRVPPHHSPFVRCRVLPSMMKSTSAQSLRNKISGLDTFTAWGPPRSIGPRSLSCLRINPSVAVQAARLDTGPVASRYPGGSFPRLSCRHCQVASCKPLLDGSHLTPGPVFGARHVGAGAQRGPHRRGCPTVPPGAEDHRVQSHSRAHPRRMHRGATSSTPRRSEDLAR